MDNQQLDAIYKRHMTAIERVSAGGTWIDRSAVGIVLSLAIDEAASTAVLRCENESEMAVSQLRGQLAEISRMNVDLEARRQDWQRTAEEQQVAAASSFGQLGDLHTWLATNDIPTSGFPVKDAITTLNAWQDEIAALGAANATLRERLTQAPAVLLPTLNIAANEFAGQLGAVLAIVDHGGDNGNGVAAAPPVKRHKRQAAAPDNSGRLTKEETKALAFRLVRELNRELSRPPKMKEFDDARPEEDIATAEAVMKRFGFISWMALVDAALTEKGEAAA